MRHSSSGRLPRTLYGKNKDDITLTRIITAFIQSNGSILLLKRSKKVKSMKGLWAGISGIIEGAERPLDRAKIEIFEEAGIPEDKILLIKAAKPMEINSPQHRNHKWNVFPFLFEAKNPVISLNWENSEYRWIKQDELIRYKTVPSLDNVLFSLL